MLSSGVFLPRWYGYPSFSFYVALLPSLKYTATLRLEPELCFGSRPDSSDSLQEASLFEGYVNKHPELKTINKKYQRNEGSIKSLASDQVYLQSNTIAKDVLD